MLARVRSPETTFPRLHFQLLPIRFCQQKVPADHQKAFRGKMGEVIVPLVSVSGSISRNDFISGCPLPSVPSIHPGQPSRGHSKKCGPGLSLHFFLLFIPSGVFGLSVLMLISRLHTFPFQTFQLSQQYSFLYKCSLFEIPGLVSIFLTRL